MLAKGFGLNYKATGKVFKQVVGEKGGTAEYGA